VPLLPLWQVVNSALIFDTCYFILFFGVGTPQHRTVAPPDDAFRIRLLISLLSTCGHSFDRGPTKKKPDRLLVYLQNYVLAKEYLPLDVEFDLQDLYASLRPKMKVLTDPVEAGEALAREMKEEAEEREREERNERGEEGAGGEGQGAVGEECGGAHGEDSGGDRGATRARW